MEASNSESQYYWFSPEEITKIVESLSDDDSSDAVIRNISAELKVSEVRSNSSDIPVLKLGNVLGLKEGSKPLWLSREEYIVVHNMLRNDIIEG